jgi:hypothetical protein
MGALLQIIHLELYNAGILALTNLANNPSLVKEGEAVFAILKLWAIPFTGYSMISNRSTPVHRDNSSRPEAYDLLATLGSYHSGKMKLPGLGLILDYNPGTVVALSGRIVLHEVPEVVGNRVCLAYYMRDNVHERHQVPVLGWMNIFKYQ